jgi:ribosomal protein S18 acetylase RimI-like enzyme
METLQPAPRRFTVRPAERRDLPALGRLGARLLRLHYGLDPQRFMAPGDEPERGYAWFLGTQLRDEQVVILVADGPQGVVGYIYAAVEPRSWKELREEAGFVHDLVVDEHVRGQGVGTALLEAAVGWFRARGLPRVVLWTAEHNAPAQQLFAGRGFRRTMVEMTREIV